MSSRSPSADADKLRTLAQLLDIPLSDLKKKLDSDRSFVYLKRQVELDTVDKIVALEIPGIHTRKEYKRFYPTGHVAAHILGFTNVEDIGQEGIEWAQQSALGGVTGSRRVIKDKLGRVIEDIGYIREPQDGRDLTLSIDSKIQYIAFTQLQQAVEHDRAGRLGQGGELVGVARLLLEPLHAELLALHGARNSRDLATSVHGHEEGVIFELHQRRSR